MKMLYGEVIVTPFVKVECVDRGKEMSAVDVIEIEKGMQEGWIRLETLTRKQRHEAENLLVKTKIGLGEAEALTLARDTKLMVILDDKEARAIARSWNLNYTSTVMLLYQAFVRKLLNYEELIQSLSDLARVMWISADVIMEIIRRAKEAKI